MLLVVTGIKIQPYDMTSTGGPKGTTCMVSGFNAKTFVKTDYNNPGVITATGYQSGEFKVEDERIARDIMDKLNKSMLVPVVYNIDLMPVTKKDQKGNVMRDVVVSDAEFRGQLGKEFTFTTEGVALKSAKPAGNTAAA